jgi:hypothetical protein
MILNQRLTARLDGEFVVFLIDLRINRPLALHKWVPVVRATFLHVETRCADDRHRSA